MEKCSRGCFFFFSISLHKSTSITVGLERSLHIQSDLLRFFHLKIYFLKQPSCKLIPSHHERVCVCEKKQCLFFPKQVRFFSYFISERNTSSQSGHGLWKCHHTAEGIALNLCLKTQKATKIKFKGNVWGRGGINK